MINKTQVIIYMCINRKKKDAIWPSSDIKCTKYFLKCDNLLGFRWFEIKKKKKNLKKNQVHAWHEVIDWLTNFWMFYVTLCLLDQTGPMYVEGWILFN
jgi:chaperone required for assembly of F1-ATPase